MRRLRADQLTLVPAEGPPITLFTETREPGELTTQDLFQASPDGAYLAYAAHGSLHLRAVDGSERIIAGYAGLMRFSPDAQYLAIYVGGDRVQVLDLAAGTTRELATPPSVLQMEWLREALVVQTYDSLVELPLAGAPIPLLEHESFYRFVAAGTGTRVVAFLREAQGTRIVALDRGARHELGFVHDEVTNAAATLDGQHVAFTTFEAVFASDGDAAPHVIAGESYVHSLWFARDGRLGFASAPSAMLRFDPLSSDALVATGDLLGLDHFAGGYVTWKVQ